MKARTTPISSPTLISFSSNEPPYALDSWGDAHDVQYGVLDDDADWLLKHGQCHAFAVALRERLGGEIVGIWTESTILSLVEDANGEWDWWENSPTHVAIRLPNGMLGDASGVVESDMMAEFYGEPVEIRDLSPEYVDDICSGYRGYHEANLEWARSLVNDVVSQRIN